MVILHRRSVPRRRLAFERTGTRLYEARLGKHAKSDPLPSGPSREDREKIHREELEHFEMLRVAMIGLGADPTAMTPSADVAAVGSAGVLQVIADPRMNLKQSLEAILIAERVDKDGGSILIELAKAGGHASLVPQFEKALKDEQEHVVRVRGWVKKSTLAAGAPVATAASSIKSKLAGRGNA